MRRFDPQDHSPFTLEEGIFITTHVLLGKLVDVLCRSLVGTKLVDNGAADHNGPPRILRIDDRDRDPWIAVDVIRLEVSHDRVDEDVRPVWLDIDPHRCCLWRSIRHNGGDDGEMLLL